MPEDNRLPAEEQIDEEKQVKQPNPFMAALGKVLFVFVLLAMIAAAVFLTDYVVSLLGKH